MTVPARLGASACLAFASLSLTSNPTWAQSYPTQLVRIVVPFSAGSVTDLLARLIAERLGETWQQQVIVENRPGLTGTISVAKSAPDGHTLMLTSNGHTVLGAVNKSLPFDLVKDFAGVTQVASVPLIVIVTPTLPVNSLAEFFAMVREKPGALNYASSGPASTAYIAAELLKREAKLNLMHVPYKGAPESLTSVMRADSQMFFAGSNIGMELIQSGKVKALAVTPVRLPALPALPTIAEAGLPSFDYDAWFGIMAPAGTPQPILSKVSTDVASILKQPAVRDRLATQGVLVKTSTPAEFSALAAADTARFAPLFETSGAQ